MTNMRYAWPPPIPLPVSEHMSKMPNMINFDDLFSIWVQFGWLRFQTYLVIKLLPPWRHSKCLAGISNSYLQWWSCCRLHRIRFNHFFGKVTFLRNLSNLCRLSILQRQRVASLCSLSLVSAGGGGAQNWSILKIHPNYFYTKNQFAMDSIGYIQ